MFKENLLFSRKIQQKQKFGDKQEKTKTNIFLKNYLRNNLWKNQSNQKDLK